MVWADIDKQRKQSRTLHVAAAAPTDNILHDLSGAADEAIRLTAIEQYRERTKGRPLAKCSVACHSLQRSKIHAYHILISGCTHKFTLVKSSSRQVTATESNTVHP